MQNIYFSYLLAAIGLEIPSRSMMFNEAAMGYERNAFRVWLNLEQDLKYICQLSFYKVAKKKKKQYFIKRS